MKSSRRRTLSGCGCVARGALSRQCTRASGCATTRRWSWARSSSSCSASQPERRLLPVLNRPRRDGATGRRVVALAKNPPDAGMPEQLIGTVVHYFKGPSVAIVRLTDGELALGDRVRFHGHTTELTPQVASMELKHTKVARARAADEARGQVGQRARQPHQLL